MSSWTILDVQSGQVSGASTLQLPAFATNPAVGDLIVVGESDWHSTLAKLVSTPSDTYGNTYSAVGSALIVVSTERAGVYSAPVTTGGGSFRVTGNAAAGVSELAVIAWLLRESNGAPVYNNDFKFANGTSVANPSSGTTTPAPAAGSLFLAFMANVNATAVSDGSGWNALTNGFTSTMLSAARLTDNTTHQDLYSEWMLSSAAANGQWTEVADTWVAAAMSWGPGAVVVVGEALLVRQAVKRAATY